MNSFSQKQDSGTSYMVGTLSAKQQPISNVTLRDTHAPEGMDM